MHQRHMTRRVTASPCAGPMSAPSPADAPRTRGGVELHRCASIGVGAVTGWRGPGERSLGSEVRSGRAVERRSGEPVAGSGGSAGRGDEGVEVRRCGAPDDLVVAVVREHGQHEVGGPAAGLGSR